MALNELLGDAYREGMSEEEISQAFEKVLAKRDAETAKLKNAFNKASSDVAKYKQDLKDHMSDEEKKANEQKELLEKLQKENEEFKKQSVITDNKAKFIGLGYSEDLAQQTAEALFNGDLTTFFTNQKAVWDAKEKEIRADAEALKKLVGTGHTTLPTKNMDQGTGDDKDAGLRQVLKSIKQN